MFLNKHISSVIDLLSQIRPSFSKWLEGSSGASTHQRESQGLLIAAQNIRKISVDELDLVLKDYNPNINSVKRCVVKNQIHLLFTMLPGGAYEYIATEGPANNKQWNRKSIEQQKEILTEEIGDDLSAISKVAAGKEIFLAFTFTADGARIYTYAMKRANE